MNGDCRNYCISTREVSSDSGTEYNYIADALTAAQDGDVISLSPGIHDVTDSVNVSLNSLTITGDGAIIRALTASWVGGTTNNDALVNFGATDGTAPVNECAIEKVQLSVEPNIHGLQVNGGEDNRAINIHVSSTALKSSIRVGILFTDSVATSGKRFFVNDCLVDSSGSATAWVDGVHMDGNNTLSTYGYGNGIVESLVRGNIVKYNLETSYVFVDCMDSAVFVNRSSDVSYSAGAIGMALIGCTDCLVNGNSVKTNNNAGSAAAMWLSNSTGCIVTANSFDGDGTSFPIGVHVRDGSDNNIVGQNTFRDCTVAITIAAGSDANIINPNQYISGITTRIADASTTNRYVGNMREAAGNPNGVVSGNFGDTYLNTAGAGARYICISYPVGTSWRVI